MCAGMVQEAFLHGGGEAALVALVEGAGGHRLLRVLVPHVHLEAVGLDGRVGTVLTLVRLLAAVTHAVATQGIVVSFNIEVILLWIGK